MIQEQFKAFIDDLKATHGSNLASVILYGSAATGDHIAHHSDYNLLIALNKISPADLRAAQAPVREWHRMGHPTPLYFTAAEVKDALDVFPIEFNQMQKARVVLFGDDLLAGAVLTNEHLRHQTEYELRSKLIQLRRRYIPASNSAEQLVMLMHDSLGSFVALFRAALLLHGVEPPLAKAEIIVATEKHLHLNGDVFARIMALTEKGAKQPDDVKANEIFTAYMEEIERVIDAVDKLNDNT
jgi:hypothetical protein